MRLSSPGLDRLWVAAALLGMMVATALNVQLLVKTWRSTKDVDPPAKDYSMPPHFDDVVV